jgi:hypothetical protein
MWEERPTCLIWTGKQGGLEWLGLRVGRITASNISKVCNRSRYHTWNHQSNVGLAKALLGVDDHTSCPRGPSAAMHWGTDNEPAARRFIQERVLFLREPIREVGLAIDRSDDRFACSVDGEISEKLIIEIKLPQFMPENLILRAQQVRHVPHGHDENTDISNEHYDQMQVNLSVMDKKKCLYFVCPKFLGSKIAKGKKVLNGANGVKLYYYKEWVDIDTHHYTHVLKPAAIHFYNTYMHPLIQEDPLLKRIHIPHLAHHAHRGHVRDEEKKEDDNKEAVAQNFVRKALDLRNEMKEAGIDVDITDLYK